MSTAASKLGRRLHPRARPVSTANPDPPAPPPAAAAMPASPPAAHARDDDDDGDDGAAYEARTAARVARTGIVERSVAAAVFSAARQRGLARKPRSPPPPPPPPPAHDLPAHHRRHGGFRNPWDSALREGAAGAIRTRAGSGSRTFFHKVAKDRRPPDEQLATMLLLASLPDFALADHTLQRDKYALASFWIGHCTFLLRAKGLTVLTDPVWSLRLGPLGPKRLIPPPCPIDALPKTIDAVILSSACYDHYDKAAVAALAARVDKWLVPLGLKQLLTTAGVPDDSVVELDWWEEHKVKGCMFACTPAQHYSIRDDALWCSWVVHAPHHKFFYCGATGYRPVSRDIEDSDSFSRRSRIAPCCPVFKEISRRYGSCDTAFLPIGGFKPRVLMSGVQGDALDMLFVHRDLRARRSVVHRWGTFACNDEGMLDAVRTLENALLNGPVQEHEVSYLKHGQMHVT